MPLPNPDVIKDSYERRDLDEQEITRFDELIDQRHLDTEVNYFGDETLKSIIQDAEKWDNVPREVYVIDFWRPPEVIMNYLAELGQSEIENPDIEGAKFSQALIETGQAMDSGSHGYLVEVDNKLDDSQSYNPNMIGSVSQIYDFVPIPEPYQDDDLFTENTGNGKLGIIENDHTVIAQQGLSAAEWIDSQTGSEIPYGFRQAVRESIESYTHSNQSEE